MTQLRRSHPDLQVSSPCCRLRAVTVNEVMQSRQRSLSLLGNDQAEVARAFKKPGSVAAGVDSLHGQPMHTKMTGASRPA